MRLTTIEWLYRYVFRGLGIVILIGAVGVVLLEVEHYLDRKEQAVSRGQAAPRKR